MLTHWPTLWIIQIWSEAMKNKPITDKKLIADLTLACEIMLQRRFSSWHRFAGEKDAEPFDMQFARKTLAKSGINTDCGTDTELDPVAICCDWSEYSSATDAAKEMSSWESDEDADEETNEEAALEHLRDNTTVLETGESFLVLAF